MKLLDFGIAKLLEDEAAPGLATELTREGGRALTPEYAAPEQVSGGPVTTATDVYALGVLLYVLLTGRHPAETSAAVPRRTIKAIVELESPRPSDVATDVRARRLLRGDLDTIIGKALKKNPADRYASVTALAEDLRRHPCATSQLARDLTRDLSRREVRAPASVAGGRGGRRVRDAGGRPRRGQPSATDRREPVPAIAPSVGAGVRARQATAHLAGATDARQTLVAASLEYLEGLARDARGDLDLMQEVGDGYWRVARIQGVPTGLNLGDFVKAEESLKKADALIETVLAARPRDPRALERSAAIAQDRMIVAQSERRDADSIVHARKAIERADALLAAAASRRPNGRGRRGLYTNVATAYLNVGDYDNGVRLAKRALEVARVHGVDRMISGALSVLANALRLQGDLDGALKAIREAREIVDRSTYATESERMFDRYAVLLREGFILGEDRGISLERPEEAIVPLREAFEMQEAGARRDPNDYTSRTRVGTSGRELGDILRWREPEEAIAVYDMALVRLGEIKNNVKARRDTALILANSSYALRRLNRSAEAKRRLERRSRSSRKPRTTRPIASRSTARSIPCCRPSPIIMPTKGGWTKPLPSTNSCSSGSRRPSPISTTTCATRTASR